MASSSRRARADEGVGLLAAAEAEQEPRHVAVAAALPAAVLWSHNSPPPGGSIHHKSFKAILREAHEVSRADQNNAALVALRSGVGAKLRKPRWLEVKPGVPLGARSKTEGGSDLHSPHVSKLLDPPAGDDFSAASSRLHAVVETDDSPADQERLLERRHSSMVLVELEGGAASRRPPSAKDISKNGRWRASQKDWSEQDLVGKHRPMQRQESAEEEAENQRLRFETVSAFVARRIYRRIREGHRQGCQLTPFLQAFHEKHFLKNSHRHAHRGGRSQEGESSLATGSSSNRRRGWCWLFLFMPRRAAAAFHCLSFLFIPRRFREPTLSGEGTGSANTAAQSGQAAAQSQARPDGAQQQQPPQEEMRPTPTATDVYEFLHRFALWCALPTDLLIVALVYVDRLLDRSSDVNGSTAQGVLTADTWKPVLVAGLVLASKVWEDWCVCNFEAAQFAHYTDQTMLRLELLVMDAFDWNANISAETFAPYFWAAERAIVEGVDDVDQFFVGPLGRGQLSRSRRGQLEESVRKSPLQIEVDPMSPSFPDDPSIVSDESQGSFVQLRSSSVISAGSGEDPPLEGSMRHIHETLEELQVLTGSMSEKIRDHFVFVDRFENRYRVIGTLGRGSFGVVHHIARRDDSTKTFAVKLFTNIPERWKRRARLLVKSFILSGVACTLSHPNIVSYMEFVIDESRSPRKAALTPVMEALLGPDLFDWLAGRQEAYDSGEAPWISEREVAHIAVQVFRGLAYLHTRRPYIVHRDVKAENLRWTHSPSRGASYPIGGSDGGATLKLVDFGLAYIDGYEDGLRGQIVGTPLYSAPEMLDSYNDSGLQPEPSLDMYSAGVVVYLVLAAAFPYTECADRKQPLQLDGAPWDRVSPSAGTLVKALLCYWREGRPTAEEALDSPWFHEGIAAAAVQALDSPDFHKAADLRQHAAEANMVRMGVLPAPSKNAVGSLRAISSLSNTVLKEQGL